MTVIAFLLGFILFIIGIVKVVRKKPAKKIWIAWAICSVVFIAGAASGGTETETAMEPKEEVKAEPAEKPAEEKKEDKASEDKAAEEAAEKEAEEKAAAEAKKKEEEAAAKKEAEEKAKKEAEEAEKPKFTLEQENAIRKAEDYLDYTAFSKSGLIKQLEYEGFSNADATLAVNTITVDWMDQAAQKAQDYLDYTSFSREGLIQQLQYEGFTAEEAAHGATAVGY